MYSYFKLGKVIYGDKGIRPAKRLVVFVFRCLLHDRKIREMTRFFANESQINGTQDTYPHVVEQLTRCVFYLRSTTAERLAIIKEHYAFRNSKFKPRYLRRIDRRQPLMLWEQDHAIGKLSLNLVSSSRDNREGLWTLELKRSDKRVYHVTFWFAITSTGELSIVLGTLQGKRAGAEVIHDLTKCFAGFRPKNLVIYSLRIIAEQLGITTIHAVSNYGFYANNHIRVDRKLKTSLDEFWLETGGQLSADPRFFMLPIQEPRKNIETVKPHKRSLYRKRFALLDTFKDVLVSNFILYLRDGACQHAIVGSQPFKPTAPSAGEGVVAGVHGM